MSVIIHDRTRGDRVDARDSTNAGRRPFVHFVRGRPFHIVPVGDTYWQWYTPGWWSETYETLEAAMAGIDRYESRYT